MRKNFAACFAIASNNLPLGKRENRYHNVWLKLCTRVVASLLAVFLLQYVKRIRHIYTVTAIVGIVGFVSEVAYSGYYIR